MKKTKIFLWSLIIIILILLVVYFGGVFSTFGDTEAQLRSQYNTYWGDSTDGLGTEKFDCTTKDRFGQTVNSPIGTGSDFLSISAGQGGTTNCVSTKNFIGQEVVLLISGSGSGIQSHDTFGSCSHLSCVNDGDKSSSRSTTSSCPQTMIKFIPHTFDTSIYDVIHEGRKTGEINVGNNFDIPISCGASGLRNSGFNGKIDYIGFKAEFACDLSGEEVWIQEQFAESFDVEDLEFSPTKFCHETRPFVLRRLDEGEKPIRKEEGIQIINSNGIISASSTDLVTVNYAAFFVSGVLNKCAPNQANVRDSNGNWVCSDVIKPLEIVVQCQENSDCPRPLKNKCPGYFQGCQNNFCMYDNDILDSVVCKNEVVTIIKEIEKIQERELITVSGENVFGFTANYPSGSFDFGNKEFNGEIDYICDTPEGEIIRFPNPNPDCYTGTATFDEKKFELKDGNEFNIKDNILVKFFVGGQVLKRESESKTKEKLSSSFVFIVNDAFDIDISDTSEILINSGKEVSININNNLFDGIILLKVKQTSKRTNQILPELRLDKSVVEGNNEVKFILDTSNLGIQELNVQAFYKIDVDGTEILIPSDKLVFNYDVVNELSGVSDVIIVEKEVFKEVMGDTEFVTVKEEVTSPTALIIISILVFIIMVLVILYFKRK